MFRVISGERGGAVSAARAGLIPVSWIYGSVVKLRNVLYDSGFLFSRRAPVPVISVGNLSVGGTGKTPAAAMIAKMLASMGRKPGIASRGYGSAGGCLNDENLMLSEALRGIPLAQDADRHATVVALAGRCGADCAVLDDGFQHRRLRRDLDVLVIDAASSEHSLRMLPAGSMREPMESVARASLVIVAHADWAGSDAVEMLKERIRGFGFGGPVLTSAVAATGVLGPGGRSPAWFSDRRIHLVSGIGNPGYFRRTAEGLNAVITGESIFPDHHAYSAAEIARVSDLASFESADAVLATSKDWVKIRDLVPDRPPPFNAIEIEMNILDGRDTLIEKLKAVFTGEDQPVKTFR